MGVKWLWTQHPHLGRGPPAHGSGSQQGRHSERSLLCCHNGLAHRVVAPGHTHPHPLHTLSPGSQPGTHSGKSQAGSHRPLGHTGRGSGCIHPHLLRARDPGHTSFMPLPPRPPMLYSTSLTSVALTFHPPSSCHPVPMVLLSTFHHSATLSVIILTPSSSPLLPQSILSCLSAS